MPEQALGGIPLGLGMVVKINLLSFMYTFVLYKVSSDEMLFCVKIN